MKIKLLASYLVINTLLIPVTVYAADANLDQLHPLTFVNDSVITTKIKAKLAGEKMSSLTNISVNTTSKGVVVLTGKVKIQEEADKAVALASETEGVTSVRTNIQVEKVPVTPVVNKNSSLANTEIFVKDSIITTKIKAKLADEKMSSLDHINVDTTKSGAVVLSGDVKTQAEADNAGFIARDTEGVTSVKTNIQIRKAE
ncbi:MAG: BON domain-containing protein [Formivibrio sp.]|nr:BON domain-containing protein [Formivibrio sp.]